MEDLGKVIRGAWQLLLEPVLVTALMFVIWRLFVQEGEPGVRRWTLISALPDPDGRTYRVLNAYGVTKLLPIAVLLVLTLLLYGLDVSLHWVGSMMPGTVISIPSYTLVHVGLRDLRTLWLNHTELTSADDLLRYAEYSIESIKNLEPKRYSVAGAMHWDEVNAQYAALLELTKGLGVYAALVAFVAIGLGQSVRKVVWRVILILVVTVGIGVFFGAKEIYAIEQRGFSDNEILREYLFSKTTVGSSDGLLSAPEQRELKFLQERARDGWWEIRWGDIHFLQWIGRGFTEVQG